MFIPTTKTSKTISGWWFGTWFLFFHSFSWEFHNPIWRTHIFQRGRYTTNQILNLGTKFGDINGGTVPYFWPYFLGIFPETKATIRYEITILSHFLRLEIPPFRWYFPESSSWKILRRPGRSLAPKTFPRCLDTNRYQGTIPTEIYQKKIHEVCI